MLLFVSLYINFPSVRSESNRVSAGEFTGSQPDSQGRHPAVRVDAREPAPPVSGAHVDGDTTTPPGWRRGTAGKGRKLDSASVG